ncbi:MAG: 3-oxoacyl-(acyl-carrier-protein) synthase/nucleoside-diphosphate-sugar epimerase, partial [Myxococcota bacterium]
AEPGRPLWIITRGVHGAATPAAVALGALWGLARVIAEERPDAWGGLIDLDGEVPAAAVLEVLLAVRADDRFVLGTERWVPRLRPAELVSQPWTGTVLVTGGLGGVGRAVARWLSAQGGVRLVLAGRSGAGTAEARAFVASLPGEVEAIALDVTDPSAVLAVCKQYGPTSVIHLAGILADAPLTEVHGSAFETARAAKVQGAWNLHAAVGPVERFVVASSLAAILGNVGQAAYAAANAELDAVVRHRRALGLPATSVAFGPWAGPGMAAGVGSWAPGVRRLEPRAAARAFGTVGDRVVAALDWSEVMTGLGAGARAMAGPLVGARSSRSDALRSLAPEARSAAVRATVGDIVTAVLGRELASDDGFFDAGMDSLTAVELRHQLQRWLGEPVSATVAFDHPTVDALTAALLAKLEPSVPPPEQARTAAADDDPVVVVGLAFRFPGASSPDELHALLDAGGTAIDSLAPGVRWPSDGTGPRAAGLIDGIDRFDAAHFGIAPREAAAMDPQQRLLLEVSWEAVERSGLDPRSLWGTDTGVFVGVGPAEYGHRFAGGAQTAWTGTGNDPSFSAGRVSHALGLEGPALSVSTACSSSLVAVHLASAALRTGECSRALVGGVNALLSPETMAQLDAIGALSPTGRCRPFSARADGYVRGEGCGVVLLMRRSQAAAEGRPQLAVVRGSAVAHDGRAAGVTVPRGPAQEAVLRRALAAAGVPPSAVQYVECHGTGTALGDPIEAGAIARVYGRPALGSVKATFGHLEAGAGIAGLIRTVLDVHRRRMPVHPSVAVMNPDVGDLRLADGGTWEDPVAGVSAFGLSGTNAHVVLSAATGPGLVAPVTRFHRVRCWVDWPAAKGPALYRLVAEPGDDPADVSLPTGPEHVADAVLRAVEVARSGGPALFGGGRVAGAIARTLAEESPDRSYRWEMRARAVPVEPEPPQWRASAGRIYVITGGLGALGLHAACWLVDRGATTLRLVGRSAPSESARAAVDALACDVEIVTGDMSIEKDVRRVLSGDIAGVVHAVGGLVDRLASALTPDDVHAVVGPKVAGAVWLDRYTREADLDLFLLYGSASAWLGTPGQLAYAAANAALEDIATARAAAGLPSWCIAWGPWDRGLAAGLLPPPGVSVIGEEGGRSVLDRVVGGDLPVVLAIEADWELHVQVTGRVPAVLRDQVRAPAANARVGLRSAVEQAVATVLGSTSVPPRVGLMELGLDSMMAVELRDRLQRALGRPLPATLAFDHPTVDALIAFLSGDSHSEVVARAREEPIAVIGIGVRFPGASSPREFWDLLDSGGHAIIPIPLDRWDADALWSAEPQPGRSVQRHAGLVDISAFDAAFFGMSAAEAVALDPQQRLLLEVGWEALEDAGLPIGSVDGTDLGVFVGIGPSDYRARLDPMGPRAVYQGAGTDPSFAAGRLAHVLGA